MLEFKNIHIQVDGKERVHGVTLAIDPGHIIALMGPNGSGKSTFVNAIMGHPRYTITKGVIILDGEDITKIPPHEKAQKGLFLSMQYPTELPGVTVASFLRAAARACRQNDIPLSEFHHELEREIQQWGMEKSMLARYVNAGFSGGEKKRLEMLQLSLLCPSYALLDETDSGLDIDALRVVAGGIQQFSSRTGILLITHYPRIFKYLTPHEVHIMQDGIIVRSGGAELADDIEKNGYE